MSKWLDSIAQRQENVSNARNRTERKTKKRQRAFNKKKENQENAPPRP
jgi:hypothetical protein